MEEILIVLVCLLLNALLSAFEMSFISVPKPELRCLARTGDKDAQRLLVRRDHPERTLSVIQIGISLVGALAAAVGGAGAAESIEPVFIHQFGMSEITAESLAIILVVIPLTYLSVVLGELVPKTLALRSPIKVAITGARWVALADRFLSPAVSILEWSTKKFLAIFFPRVKSSTPPSETVVEIDALSPVHQQYILNLARIENKRIKDMMLPWSNVNFVRSGDKMEEVAHLILSLGHTRLPVTDNGNVVGILHTKEFISFRETNDPNWISIVRPALKVQVLDSAIGTLRLMQEKRSHMAVVCGPTGEVSGIVTMEDIIEEIVGDIYDEDDDGRIRKIVASRAKALEIV